MKTWLFLILLFASPRVFSAPDVFDANDGYEVLRGSRMQVLIDDTLMSIFESPLKKTFCQFFLLPSSLSHTLGMTESKAKEFLDSCPVRGGGLQNSKIFPKKYIFVFESGNPGDLESWTTYENQTYIWIRPDFTLGDLRRVLAHEVAIALDAKTSMLFTVYLSQFMGAQSTSIAVDSSQGRSNGNSLWAAFNASTFFPISYTFSTLRAFSFEDNVNGQAPLNQPAAHAKCTARFLSLYPFFANREKKFQDTGDSIQAQIHAMAHKANIPADLNKTLALILSPDVRMIHDQSLTFCQFMTTPMFSTTSLFSFFSNGPRPRVGGGWDGADSTQGSQPSRGASPSPDGSARGTKWPVPNSPGGPSFQDGSELVKNFKKDLDEKRIRNLPNDVLKKDLK